MHPDDPAADSKPVPSVIQGRFRVLSKISAGGMGVVFEARDELLDKRVAIKMLHSISGQSEEVIRFQREARAISQLDHENIVRVLDFGMTDDGQPYMVMDYVDGIPLSKFLDRRGQISPELCYTIFDQIIIGMAHAHRNGVIHRDLKPANVMLRNASAVIPHVVLVDFGLAKIHKAGEGEMTHTGVVAGSPYYMSPEQANAQPAGKESDVYSIGCMLFRSLTGVVPFSGETAVDTLMRHVNETAPQLSAAAGRSFTPGIENVVAKCLAKNAADRYRDMDQLRSALQDAFRLEPQAEPVTSSGQSKDRDGALSGGAGGARRIPAQNLLIASGILLLIAVSAVFGFQHWSKSKANEPEGLRDAIQTDDVVALPKGAVGDMDFAAPRDRIDIKKHKHSGKEYDLSSASNAFELLSQVKEPCSKLTLSGAHVSDQLFELIKGWPLIEIDVSRTSLTDRQLELLSRIKTIKYVKASETNEVTPGGLIHLRELPALSRLKLDNCMWSKESLPVVISLTQVQDLSLSNDDWIGSDGLKMLARAKNLRRLNLNYCPNLKLDDVNRLRAQLPSCQIGFIAGNSYLPGVNNENASKVMPKSLPGL